MSATAGPCPRCGENTMYDDREPTPCPKCRTIAADERRAMTVVVKAVGPEGNRKQRRAAAKLARKN